VFGKAVMRTSLSRTNPQTLTSNEASARPLRSLRSNVRDATTIRDGALRSAYDIFATASDYFPFESGAPPSCPNWTVIRDHATCRRSSLKCDPGHRSEMSRVQEKLRIAKHKAAVGSVR
jgi:hypothetical protein